MAEKNISSVRIVIREFLSRTRNINESNVWEWFSSFRETLAYQEFSEQKNEYAEHLLADADNYIALCYVQGIEGAMAKNMDKTELSYKAVHDACCEKYGEEYIAAKAKEKSYLADHPGTETIWTKKYRKFIDGADVAQKYPNNTKAIYKKENEKKTENPVERPTKSDSKGPGDLVYGSCKNVFLTQDEFNKIAMDVGNLKEANGLVEDLSLNLADGKIESSNHFATLQKWAKWRKNHPNDERLETFHERDDRNQIETLRKVFSM